MTTKIYTKQELYAFQAELESAYRINKTTRAGDNISFIDFDQYLVDQNALVRREGDYGPAIRDIGKCLELNEKFGQLKDMMRKKAYAQKKDAEELVAMHP